MDQAPPPGSPTGTILSENSIKLFAILDFPHINAGSIPLMEHFLIFFGCHCFKVSRVSFFRLVKSLFFLTQWRLLHRLRISDLVLHLLGLLKRL